MQGMPFRKMFVVTLLVLSIPVFFWVRYSQQNQVFDNTGIGYTIYVTLAFSLVSSLLLSTALWAYFKKATSLTHAQAQSFYDRFGKKQDTQAFYEDAALDKLIAHAGFDQAQQVFELGCGTGRLASRLLSQHLPNNAHYLGIDLSQTMIELARQKLVPYLPRAQVMHSDGPMHFPLADERSDRVIATYVLDLLSPDDIRAAFTEAHRVLIPGGKFCLASLATGSTLASHFVCSLWSTLYRLHAPLVGGCRPIQLESYVDHRLWSVEYRDVVIQFGVPSEVRILSAKKNSSDPTDPVAV